MAEVAGSTDRNPSKRFRAWVKRSPPGERGRWQVWRERPDGTLDIVTWERWFKRAEQAAQRYERFGIVTGLGSREA